MKTASVSTSGIRVNFLEAGEGPLIMLLFETQRGIWACLSAVQVLKV